MPDRYGFDKQSVERISRAVKGFEKNGNPPVKEGIVDNNNPSIVKTPSGGISGRNQQTVSKAECTKYHVNKDSGVLVEGGKVDVYNLSDKAVSGGSYIMPSKDKRGVLVVDSSDSSGTARVKFTENFTGDNATVNCRIDRSDFDEQGNAEIVANNLMKMSSDADNIGYVHRWANGDYDLIAAQCPVEE
jgi:hypothetical protein